MKIAITVGQPMHYRPAPSNRVMKIRPDNEVATPADIIVHAAIVAHVISQDEVNLACFDSMGNHYAAQRVRVGSPTPDDESQTGWCDWPER
jgi:hypothetical protein